MNAGFTLLNISTALQLTASSVGSFSLARAGVRNPSKFVTPSFALCSPPLFCWLLFLRLPRGREYRLRLMTCPFTEPLISAVLHEDAQQAAPVDLRGLLAAGLGVLRQVQGGALVKGLDGNGMGWSGLWKVDNLQPADVVAQSWFGLSVRPTSSNRIVFFSRGTFWWLMHFCGERSSLSLLRVHAVSRVSVFQRCLRSVAHFSSSTYVR